jgi:hypothetical protein
MEKGNYSYVGNFPENKLLQDKSKAKGQKLTVKVNS